MDNSKLISRKGSEIQDSPIISDELFAKSESINNLSDKQKEFISSLRFISKVNLQNITDAETIENAATIANYVCNVNSENKELKKLFGFSNNSSKSSVDEWKNHINNMGESERKFLIGDLKLKAFIFLARADIFRRKLSKSNKVTYEDFKTALINAPLSTVVTAFGGDWGKIKQRSTENNTDKKATIVETIGEWLGLSDEKRFEIPKDAKKYLDLCAEFVEAVKEDNDAREPARKLHQIEQDLADKDLNSPAPLNFFSNIDSVGKEISNDIKYYIFDNSMNEVQFIGLEHNWLWRYEKDKKTLFRCVGTDEFATSPHENKFYYPNNDAASGRTYYQYMIQNLVHHMNTGKNENKNKLSSYSKNPVRDIFKYMSLPPFDGNYTISFEETEKHYNITLPVFRNDERKCLFAMVRNADTNIVKKMTAVEEGENSDFILDKKHYKCAAGDKHSFSELINGNVDTTAPYNFCVDVLNSYAPPNSRDPRLNFKNYTATFPNADVSGLQLNIVAAYDEEVVMMGNTCDSIEVWEPNKPYEIQDNIEYRVELSFEEIVGLFWRIAYERYCEQEEKPNQINKKIAKRCAHTLEGAIRCKNGNVTFHFDNVEIDRITIKVNNEIISDDNAYKIEAPLSEHLCNTAEGYAKAAKDKLDFIINFIKKNATRSEVFKNNCTNIYKPESGDPLLNLYRCVLL